MGQILFSETKNTRDMAESHGQKGDTAPLANAVDIEHVSPIPVQLSVAVGLGFRNSPLAKLPGELRNAIWELVLVSSKGFNFTACSGKSDRGLEPSPENEDKFSSTESQLAHYSVLHSGRTAAITCPQFLWALNLMAVCQQLRHETRDLLLRLNDINMRGVWSTQTTKIGPNFQSELLLKKIPSSLGSNLNRVVLWPTRTVINSCMDGLPFRWDTHGAANRLSEYAQAIHPFRLYLGLEYYYARWAVGKAQVCKHDSFLTFDHCTCIVVVIPVGDGPAAFQIIDEAIDQRLFLLRRHRTYRMCQVRAMLPVLERGLDTSRRYMKQAVNHCLDDSKDEDNAEDAMLRSRFPRSVLKIDL